MNEPGITIGRLNVSLPEGFESRAADIGRKIAYSLAEYRVNKNSRIDRLKLSAIKINNSDSNESIAADIARQLWFTINNHSGDR